MTRTPAHRAVAAVAVGVLGLGLAACGGGADEPERPGTVTVTPTVTATDAPSEAPAQTPTTAAAKPPTSDVKDRAFDLGVITKLGSSGGVGYIELDRWTVRNLDDKDLAAKGYPVRVIEKSPFFNQNAELTYTVPLSSSTNVLYHHCTDKDLPAQTRSASLKAMAGLKAPENVVVVALKDGVATSLQNYPVCG